MVNSTQFSWNKYGSGLQLYPFYIHSVGLFVLNLSLLINTFIYFPKTAIIVSHKSIFFNVLIFQLFYCIFLCGQCHSAVEVVLIITWIVVYMCTSLLSCYHMLNNNNNCHKCMLYISCKADFITEFYLEQAEALWQWEQTSSPSSPSFPSFGKLLQRFNKRCWQKSQSDMYLALYSVIILLNIIQILNAMCLTMWLYHETQ